MEVADKDEVDAAFARYNRNGDGLLDLDELRVLLDDANYQVDASYVHGLQDMFGKWDIDGSGGIELGEFRELWAQLNLGELLQAAGKSVRVAAAAPAARDLYAEVAPAPPELPMDEVDAAFARYNRNGDGLLDLDELRVLLDDANYQVDASYVHGLQDMFGKWDTDGSGGIELGEFRELWAQLNLGELLQAAGKSVRVAAAAPAARDLYAEVAPAPPELPMDEVDAAFARYNRNGDGLLDLDELRVLLDDANYQVDASYVHGLQDMFGKWDTDGSGGIELGEFRELWAQLNLGELLQAASKSVRVAAAAPAARDLYAEVAPAPPELPMDEVDAAFARYNRNGDGLLDLDELRVLLDDANYQVDASYVHGLQDMFGKWDTDGSGGIELGEFRELWAQLNLGELLQAAGKSVRVAAAAPAARDLYAEVAPAPPELPMDEVDAAFARYNRNGDGLLDLDELRVLLDDANYQVDASYVHGLQDMFGKWDTDGSGGIELGEFRELWAQLNLGELLQAAGKSVRVAAAAPAARDLYAEVAPAPPELPMDEVDAAFARYNRNGDGLLDLDELRVLLDDANYQVDASYVHGLQDMFGKWDTDGSGGIELGEFRELWAQLNLGELLQAAGKSVRVAAAAPAARDLYAEVAPAPPELPMDEVDTASGEVIKDDELVCDRWDGLNEMHRGKTLRQIFDMYDTDKSGWIGPKEMADWFRHAAETEGEDAEELAMVALEQFAGGDTLLDFHEFCEMWKFMHADQRADQLVCDRWDGLNEMYRGKTLRQIFDMYDTDKSGSIGLKEITDWFRHAAETEGEDAEELAMVALEQFAGGDTLLDFHEFREMWKFMHADQDRIQAQLDGIAKFSNPPGVSTNSSQPFREEFYRHNERLQQQELLANRLVQMPQLANGPVLGLDHGADTLRQNILAAKRFLNAEDFAAAAGALRVAALNFVQPQTGSGELYMRLYDTILEYRLAFGIFTACRRFVKYRRHHARVGRTEKVTGFGLCLAMLADALGCWCFVSMAMDSCHKIMFLLKATMMHIDIGEFVSSLRLIGYIRQLDPTVDVSMLISQCKGHRTNTSGLHSLVTAGKEFEAVLSSLKVAIEGCTHIGTDPTEAISMKGLAMAHRAQTYQELRGCKDELHKAHRLSASFGDIRKQAEVLLNLGLVFRGRTNEHAQALKVAGQVRELDSRAVSLGKVSLFQIKGSDPLQPQPTSGRGKPPRGKLSSSHPAASRSVEMPVSHLTRNGQLKTDKASAKTLPRGFSRYNSDNGSSFNLAESRPEALNSVSYHVESSVAANQPQIRHGKHQEKVPARRALFGASKDRRQRQEQDATIRWAQDVAIAPQVVNAVSKRLFELRAFSVPGLFRESGARTEVLALEDRLGRLGSHPRLSAIREVLSHEHDVHVLTVVLKRWLHTIVEQTPLIPEKLLQQSETIADLYNRPHSKEHVQAEVQRFFNQLAHKPFARSVVALLQQVTDAEDTNHMNGINLGRVLAPTLVHRPPTEVAKVLKDAQTIALLVQYLPRIANRSTGEEPEEGVPPPPRADP